MTVIRFKTFNGELPRLPARELPEGFGQEVVDSDLQHGELRGLRGDFLFASVPTAAPIRAVFTDDGVNFYAWQYEVYPVKSMVPKDIYWRLYYTAMQPTGPIIKVARTRRQDGTDNPPAVIGTALVGGNWQSPERSSPGDLGTGPDSWILGVPAPEVQGNGDIEANLEATLVDKPAWPDIPNLRLKVVYFLEDLEGRIVFEQDISNTEAGVAGGVTYPAVEYTNAADAISRGNKVQDMLWPLGYTPRPFKYYFFAPPGVDFSTLTSRLDVTNTGSGNIVITFGGTTTPPSGGTYPGPYLDIAAVSTDDYKWIIQQTGSPGASSLVSEGGGFTGDLATIHSMYNYAWGQGGSPQGADTQPGVIPPNFNLSGYPPYTPSATISNFVTAWLTWQSGQSGGGGGGNEA